MSVFFLFALITIISYQACIYGINVPVCVHLCVYFDREQACLSCHFLIFLNHRKEGLIEKKNLNFSDIFTVMLGWSSI